MTDITQLVDDYLATWNEGDPAARRAKVDATFTDDASYLDPLMQGEGREGIDAMIAGAQAQFPGHRFVLAEAPDAHHDRVRFSWHLVADEGGARVATGHDYAELEDGRFRAVTGFLQQA